MDRFKDPQIWSCFEDAGAMLLARVEDWDGNLATQASITSIACNVFDLDAGKAETYSASLTVASVIFDTEQTGGNWPYSDGYTFKFLLPKTALPTGGHRYVCEILVTPVAGEDYPIGPYHLHGYSRIAG